MNIPLARIATSGTPATARRPVVRPAVPADAESIVRLRSAHVLSEPMNEEWILRCTEELAPRLAHTGDARAFVIDTGDGSIDACALGLIHPLLPTPAYPKGLAARVHVVATRPDVRRRGYARAVVSALLDHLRTEQITLFELHASEEAAPLYRELGFAGSPALMRMAATAAQPTVPDLRPEHVATKSSPKPEHYAETVAKATMWACLYFTDEDDQPLQVHSVYSPRTRGSWWAARWTPASTPGRRPYGSARKKSGSRLLGSPVSWPRCTACPAADGPTARSAVSSTAAGSPQRRSAASSSTLRSTTRSASCR